jgi:hypothetical protein
MGVIASAFDASGMTANDQIELASGVKAQHPRVFYLGAKVRANGAHFFAHVVRRLAPVNV